MGCQTISIAARLLSASIGTGHANDDKASSGIGNVDAKQENWTIQDYWTGSKTVKQDAGQP